MTFAQVLATALERANQLQTYWTFYATLVLAILAFFGSAKRSRVVAGLVTIGFLAVAVANLQALSDVSVQRIALQEYLVELGAADPRLVSIASGITPSSIYAVRSFHAVFDLFTVISIWTLTLRS